MAWGYVNSAIYSSSLIPRFLCKPIRSAVNFVKHQRHHIRFSPLIILNMRYYKIILWSLCWRMIWCRGKDIASALGWINLNYPGLYPEALCMFKISTSGSICFNLGVVASCCAHEIRARDFHLRNAISVVFTIYSLATTCLGRMTIFRWKYIQRKWTRLTTDPLFFRIFVILVDYGDRFLVTVSVINYWKVILIDCWKVSYWYAASVRTFTGWLFESYIIGNIFYRVTHVEAGKNTSIVIPASRKRRQIGNPVISGETVPADLREGSWGLIFG
jgi:hypothetical protein